MSFSFHAQQRFVNQNVSLAVNFEKYVYFHYLVLLIHVYNISIFLFLHQGMESKITLLLTIN